MLPYSDFVQLTSAVGHELLRRDEIRMSALSPKAAATRADKRVC